MLDVKRLKVWYVHSVDIFHALRRFTMRSSTALKIINTILSSKQLPISRPTFRQECTQSKLKVNWNDSKDWTQLIESTMLDEIWRRCLPKEVLSVGPDYILLNRKNKSLSNFLKWNLIHFCHRKLIIFSIVESMLTIKDTSYIVVYKWKNGIDFLPNEITVLIVAHFYRF